MSQFPTLRVQTEFSTVKIVSDEGVVALVKIYGKGLKIQHTLAAAPELRRILEAMLEAGPDLTRLTSLADEAEALLTNLEQAEQ
jgi:hypothetical protein